ncbi:MAG: hypothetical protein ACFB8W_02085 [Elainellaceae cyanobacterium]
MSCFKREPKRVFTTHWQPSGGGNVPLPPADVQQAPSGLGYVLPSTTPPVRSHCSRSGLTRLI